MQPQRRRASQLLAPVLDDIGIGRYQYLQCLVLGSVMLVDGCEVLLCSSIIGALESAWGISPMMRAMLVSMVFVGVLLGSLAGGHAADALGRRPVVLTTYAGIVAMAIGSSFCTGPRGMVACRFFLGLCFGAGMPATMSLFVESLPKAAGKHLMNLGLLGWAFGEIYASALLRFFMPDLTDTTDRVWRWVLRLSVLPNLVLLLPMLVFLHESPLFLLVKGRAREATEVVSYIANFNGRTVLNINRIDSALFFGPHPTSSEATPLVAGRSTNQWRMLMDPEFRWTVLCGSFFSFTSLFVYDGLLYVLPELFRSWQADLGAANELLAASAMCIPGFLLVACILVLDLSHREQLHLSWAAVAVLELGAMMLDFGDQSVGAVGLGLTISGLLKVMSFALTIFVNVYISEVFPTACRALAVAVCMTGGRIGCILAPFVYEFGCTHLRGPGSYFGLCAACCALCRFCPVTSSRYAPPSEGDDEACSLPRRLSRRLSIAPAAAAGAAKEATLERLSSEATNGAGGGSGY